MEIWKQLQWDSFWKQLYKVAEIFSIGMILPCLMLQSAFQCLDQVSGTKQDLYWLQLTTEESLRLRLLQHTKFEIQEIVQYHWSGSLSMCIKFPSENCLIKARRDTNRDLQVSIITAAVLTSTKQEIALSVEYPSISKNYVWKSSSNPCFNIETDPTDLI